MYNSMLAIVLVIILSITFYSCKDDHLHGPDEHYEAEGVVFYHKGNKIAEIFRGVTRDTLRVRVNQSSDTIDVKFYDKDKKVINPPDFTKLPMSWEISDTSLVSILQPAGKERNYVFFFRGKRNGNTHFEILIMHGNHIDYRSGKIPIRVSQ